MWRCDPPTRIVVAALAGLVASAMHLGPLALLAPLAGRPRAALLAAAAVAGCGWTRSSARCFDRGRCAESWS